ncbi:MAG TPA: rhomboid family intramembrane serine protease [Chloroflexota bacterium]|nr:rhomboid family intramembrane serine protease [Chloroflexota bacterium]
MIPLSDDNPTRSPPLVTVLLIVANVLVFLYQLSLGAGAEEFIRSCGFLPAELVTGQDVGVPTCIDPPYLTIVTSMFMHGGFLHVGSNMLYLWIFGNNVEDAMGSLRFLFFYLVCGVAAALAQTYVTVAFSPETATIPNVGASGAVAGVLGAYLVLFPGAKVKTLVALGFFWSIARVPALLVLGIWFVTQFFQGVGSLDPVVGANSGVAFWAHIGGFVAGMGLVKLLAREARGRRAMPSYRF